MKMHCFDLRINKRLHLICLIIMTLMLLGCGDGGSDAADLLGVNDLTYNGYDHDSEKSKISINDWGLTPSTMSSDLEDGIFKLNWKVSSSPVSSYYDISLHIIPNNNLTAIDFDQNIGAYEGDGICIWTWIYNSNDREESVSKDLYYDAEFNEITVKIANEYIKKSLEDISGPVYALLVVHIYDLSSLSWIWEFDIIPINIVPDP